MSILFQSEMNCSFGRFKKFKMNILIGEVQFLNMAAFQRLGDFETDHSSPLSGTWKCLSSRRSGSRRLFLFRRATVRLQKLWARRSDVIATVLRLHRKIHLACQGLPWTATRGMLWRASDQRQRQCLFEVARASLDRRVRASRMRQQLRRHTLYSLHSEVCCLRGKLIVTSGDRILSPRRLLP